MDRLADLRLLSATRCGKHRQAVLLEARAVGESQAVQLILFLATMMALLLSYEVAVRRAHRRR